MASGVVMTGHAPEIRSRSMKGSKLSIHGTGITPRPASPTHELLMPSGVVGVPSSPQASSRISSTSEDDEEANSMLAGVITMNEVLEGQIEALRLRLQVENKQHQEEKSRLCKEKDTVITAKETEIEDLKDSLVNRDERIHTLVRASEEKDRTIQSKVSEIDELKMMVKQTEEYAHKLHRQIGRVRHEKQNLESDPLYKEQSKEIALLSEELALLKKRLGDLEQELQRASKVIETQNTRIRQLEEEKGSMHVKFREELEKATKAMRQEVERMREVMRQNYEEMRQLREQNKQMHSDVKDIKELLLKNRVQVSPRPTGVQRPLTASPVHMFKPAEFGLRSSVIPKGTLSPKTPIQGVGGHQSRASGSQSVETSSRTISKTPLRSPAKPAAISGTGKGSYPAVCTMKNEPGLPSISNSGPQRTRTSLRLSSGKVQKK